MSTTWWGSLNLRLNGISPALRALPFSGKLQNLGVAGFGLLVDLQCLNQAVNGLTAPIELIQGQAMESDMWIPLGLTRGRQRDRRHVGFFLFVDSGFP